MSYKNNIKQRNKSFQGLRSFKDTLPTNIKKIIKKKGHIFSETLNSWKYIVGDELFQICYPKSFKNSNKLNESTLQIMVKRGHEIDLEYSKKQAQKFLRGKSPPDFAPEDYEINYKNRATVSDLTSLGKKQLAL